MNDILSTSLTKKPFMSLQDWVDRRYDDGSRSNYDVERPWVSECGIGGFAVDVDNKASKTTIALHDDESLLAAVKGELDRLGFRKFSLIGEGKHALAFYTTENQVVRIGVRSEFENGVRPEHPAVLQPIYKKTLVYRDEGKEQEVFIEVLPLVQTNNVGDKDRQDIAEVLRLSGYEVYDLDKENYYGNIGRITVDGKTVPVLIDTGAVSENPTTKVEGEAHLARWLVPGGSLADKSTWLQSKFEERTEPTGVITRSDLHDFEKVLRGNPSERVSSTVDAINSDRLYQDEIFHLYETAAETYANALEAYKNDRRRSEPPSFRKAIREAREKLGKDINH